MIVPDLAHLATPLDKLALLPGNPRVGDVDAIARSLSAFDQRKPVVAKRDGTVIAGNHTVQAARALGWDEVAVVWVDDDDTTAHAYALADNRTAELGGYDDAALATLIAEVRAVDAELLAATGWTDNDLADLLRRTAPPPVTTAARTSVEGGAALVRADAVAIPLAANSVDLVVTSPPYFALRSYQDEGGHYAGQIGSEESPATFLAALWTVMDECHRVLKPSGSAFINLGDKYAGAMNYNNGNGASTLSGAPGRRHYADGEGPDIQDRAVVADVADKSLMGLPWRFALGLICPDVYRGDGAQHPPAWLLRAELVWSKPNGLPEPVTDRVKRSHEQWFHLTKSPRYYAAVDEVREAHTGHDGHEDKAAQSSDDGLGHRALGRDEAAFHPLGRMPGSVWSIPSEPLTVPDNVGVDHFAAFPQEWPRRLILGWSPPGVCTACGEGRRPVVDKCYRSLGDKFAGGTPLAGRHRSGMRMGDGIEAAVLGHVCACGEPTAPARPAVVLDPFAGTGTTVMVARALGRYGIGLDLSRDYLRLAAWRVWHSGHEAKTIERTAQEMSEA